jgi:RNA-directed DNA polymerase
MKDFIERIVEIDNLYSAWDEVQKNRGAAGGDLVTLERFKRRLELNLLHLAESTENGNYIPGKVRFVTIETGNKQRQIAIWCVADRVLQRACLHELEPIFERIFLPCSYGYRPGRSVGDAVRSALKLRSKGWVWVIDADIRDCFASLDHEILLNQLQKRIVDQNLLDLIKIWLPYGRTRSVKRSGQPIGISLGAVISPLLCNVYLHQLDIALKHSRLTSIRYADDFVVLCHTRDERDSAMDKVREILHSMKLEINEDKTRLTSFEQGFTFLGVTFIERKYWYELRNIQIEASDQGESFPLAMYWY